MLYYGLGDRAGLALQGVVGDAGESISDLTEMIKDLKDLERRHYEVFQ